MAIVTFSPPAGTYDWDSILSVGGKWLVWVEDGSGNYPMYVLDEAAGTWSLCGDGAVLDISLNWESIFYAGGRWFLKRNDVWASSADLTTWSLLSLPAGFTMTKMARSDDGALWLAVGDTAGHVGGTDTVKYQVTTDLTTWEQRYFSAAWHYAQDVEYIDGEWRVLVWTTPGYWFRLRSATAASGFGAGWTYDVGDGGTGVGTDTYPYFHKRGNTLYQIASDATEGLSKRYDVATHTWVAVAAAPFNRPVYGLGPNQRLVLWANAPTTLDPAYAYNPTTNVWDELDTDVATGDADIVGEYWDFTNGESGTMVLYLDGGTTPAVALLHYVTAFDETVADETADGDDTFMAFGIAPLLLVDTANPDETPTPTAAGGVEVLDETIEGDEILEDEWQLLVQEAGTADDLMTPSTAAAVTLLEDGEASETATLYFTAEVVDETLPSTEDLISESATWLYEAATADDLPTDSATSSATLTDAAAADETAYLAHGQDVSDETATSDETLTSTFSATLIDETITAAEDLIEGGAPAVDTLVDTATADDLMTVSVASLAEIIEVATATDALLAKDAGAVAWVLNPDTTAAYWYSNFQFTDIVQVDGVILGVGPDGLCVLTGDTDNGDAIDAAVTTGLIDFGSEQKKRVKEFRYGYTSDGKMNLTVEVDDQTRGWTYPLPKNQDGLPRNGRVVPGQGLNSRYWRMALTNFAGADFDVKSSLADVIIHTRRL